MLLTWSKPETAHEVSGTLSIAHVERLCLIIFSTYVLLVKEIAYTSSFVYFSPGSGYSFFSSVFPPLSCWWRWMKAQVPQFGTSTLNWANSTRSCLSWSAAVTFLRECGLPLK